MRFGVRVPATHPIRDVVGFVQRAESAGFDACWFPDSHLNYREVWTTLGAVALATSRIQIGPTVTNLVGRHVTITASAARTVAEAAPGRFILGIGAGIELPWKVDGAIALATILAATASFDHRAIDGAAAARFMAAFRALVEEPLRICS